MSTIKDFYENSVSYDNEQIFVQGWIRNYRFQKKIFFINLNDGTYLKDLQIVCKENITVDFNNIKEKLQIGASIYVKGHFIMTSKADQPFELLASKIVVLGTSSHKYPIQPKKHSRAFLRQLTHLRTRTKLFGAIFRIRSSVCQIIHNFFHQEGFFYIQTPIITSGDCEGAGELFQVTTLDLNQIPLDENLHVDYQNDFFGKKTFLTVSGQLEAEALALSLNKVYTFGPTFRAEKSHTSRHISEFWMIEPEMAFYNLQQNMELAQKMLQNVIQKCLEQNTQDLEFLQQHIEPGLIERLKNVAYLKTFPQITYYEALEILLKSNVKFENKLFYGVDFASEHEKFLTEVYFKKPVFIINWPIRIKAFYMKNNSDNKTVAAMDLLVPKVGELIGGSQREENLDVLITKMKDFNINIEELEWYLDLRRFGSCVHSGFGIGLERLLIYMTGIDNIRDVISFPRVNK
ncbi:asparagine--tRNA ligase [Candidatus Phytoplasma phoenicium]|uniref:Asparagine--tRNA ligase n=1 Tax=Candidatus Phytoplasma phoenicium TaxID=198422 RepID=A0A2S8NUM4_9MOLU|nr:asparagine--tRNA ligase [Candidatus Phytoplasma phoenicium]